MYLLMFILAAVGMAHIMVNGTIFNPLKLWLERPGRGAWFSKKVLSMMNCYQCAGFWAGAFTGAAMAALGADPMGVHTSAWLPLAAFVYGCAGGFVSPMAAQVIIWLQSQQGDQ